MKNSKEMADAVFRIRDEYLEKKRRRNEAVKRAAVIGVPAFAAFALMIGAGAAFDRQEIGTDGISSVETAPVTNAVTSAETMEAATEETNAIKDTAVTSKATETRKETKSETSPNEEEAVPETRIPEGQPEMPAEETVPETTTAELTEGEPEIVGAEVFQPDENMDGIPESTETVNEAAFTAEQLCRQYPTLFVGGEYVCTGEKITADRLGDVMIEMAVEGSAAYATVYSLDNGQIAVRFGDTNFYIVYKAKEDQ